LLFFIYGDTIADERKLSTMEKAKDGSTVGHVFERAQLGTAPFTFLRMEEKTYKVGDGSVMPGGTCQYCGNGIRYCYWIQSADGRKFYVGSDCVNHLGDTKLVAIVESKERARKNAAARARAEAKRIAAAEAEAREVAARLPEYRAAVNALDALPHPTAYFAAQGKTRADYFRYFENADGVPSLYRLKEAIKAAADLSTAAV
jgi:hypothetical protein